MGGMYHDIVCECGIALTHVHNRVHRCPACQAKARREQFKRAEERRQADPERYAQRAEYKKRYYLEHRDKLLADNIVRSAAVRAARRAEKQRQAEEKKIQADAIAVLIEEKKRSMKPVKREQKPDRSTFVTIMQEHLVLDECPRLHLRSAILPCGVDMDLCQGCPKCA